MSLPRISICLPNLNTRPFLEERLDSILAQTCPDWELIISDNYSEDGAWEFFQSIAARDPRIRISQAPRQGMYANWNCCIRQARGDCIYIATSDDTMAPDCLERLLHALDAHPDCDVAHCPVRLVDEHSRPLPEMDMWWHKHSLFARSSGDFLNRVHLRRAPYDGLLHLLGKSVYTSITQLLVRRRLFDRIGLFETRWGSIGDFNWDMRAGLVANTIHVPDTWAGWRLHSSQATAGAGLGGPEHRARIHDMIQHAVNACIDQLAVAIREPLTSDWLPRTRLLRDFLPALGQRNGFLQRKAFLARSLFSSPGAVRAYLALRAATRQPWPESAATMIRKWLDAAGLGPSLVPISDPPAQFAPGSDIAGRMPTASPA